MGNEVRGQLSNEEWESLLKAKVEQRIKDRQMTGYMAVSVTTHRDGSRSVSLVQLDRATGRVVPELLDTFPEQPVGNMTDREVLCWWAQELLYRERGALW